MIIKRQRAGKLLRETLLVYQADGNLLIFLLVGARGFEPPTSCSQSRRAARLRHAPMSCDAFIID